MTAPRRTRRVVRAAKAAGPLPLCLYARVSTEEQALQGVSLDAQRDTMRAFAHAMRLPIVPEVFSDVASGAEAPHRRPGLQAALDMVRQGKAGGILIWRLDRLCRRTMDTLGLMTEADRDGWRLASVTEQLDTGTAVGRMVMTMLAALAEMERETIRERTRLGLDQVARQGRARSLRIPFGYRSPAGGTVQVIDDRRKLVEEPAETRLLLRMLDLQGKGLGCRRIAKAMNGARTVNPRTGRPWNYGTVRSILATAAKLDALQAAQ